MKVKINDIDIEDLFDCNINLQCGNCIINVVCNYIFGEKEDFCKIDEIEDFQQFFCFLQLWYESTKINASNIKPLNEYDLSYCDIVFDSKLDKFVYLYSYLESDNYLELCHLHNDSDTYVVCFDEIRKGRFYKYRK